MFVIVFSAGIVSGCAYYNYLYNAKKYYKEGEKEKKEQSDSDSRSGSRRSPKEFQDAIESAGRMLEYYPNSRWEDEALLLLAKAYYQTGKYRNTIGKVDELIGKYPQSEFVDEGQVWKGMALLKVVQPDSARTILTSVMNKEIDENLKAEALYALGEYYFEKEKYETAIDEYERVLELEVDDEWIREQTLIRIGECYKKMGQKDDALALYERVLESKPSRAIRFTATFQHAVIMSEVGRSEEALEVFKDLLRDSAFMDKFPMIELEAAICERRMGRIEDARERLNRLLETESRGEIAAQANYELGLLIWNNWNDLKETAIALGGAKSADRNSIYSEKADSLLKLVESLSRYWYNLEYVNRKLSKIDSAKAGLTLMYPTDTTYVDSIDIKLEETKDNRSRRGRRRDNRDDPMWRMVEEARKTEEKKPEGDSLETAAADTVAPLDSAAIADYRNSLIQKRLNNRFSIANDYLFLPGYLDSAGYYFKLAIDSEISEEEWAKAISSLAYIAHVQGDTTRHDSLLNEIIERLPDTDMSIRAQKALGVYEEIEAIDTLAVFLREAEKHWFSEDNPRTTREIYIDIANQADSSSNVRARSLLAAAFISFKRLGEDSTARDFYTLIREEYKNTDYADKARDMLKRLDAKEKKEEKKDKNGEALGEKQAEKRKTERGEKDLDRERIYDDPMMYDDFYGVDDGGLEEDDKVYEPDEVDMLPKMQTSSNIVESLLRSNYPFKLIGQEIVGEVELEFVVLFNGEITEIEVVSAEPENEGFEEAAEKVLNEIDFRPGRFRGRNVSVRLKQKFSFEPL